MACQRVLFRGDDGSGGALLDFDNDATLTCTRFDRCSAGKTIADAGHEAPMPLPPTDRLYRNDLDTR
jgi:hypothetical protein